MVNVFRIAVMSRQREAFRRTSLLNIVDCVSDGGEIVMSCLVYLKEA